MNILFFYIGVPTPIFETELELIRKHEKSGDSVRVLQCSGNLPNCSGNQTHLNSKCAMCRSREPHLGVARYFNNARCKWFVWWSGKRYFFRQCPWMSDAHFSELIPQCKTLISGTGWASAFEHDARKLAKQMGCHSIAVIDHWTNYRARFVRDGEEVLPDKIWVADEYAKRIAEIEFPDIQIVQLQNVYLKNLVREVQEHKHNKTASSATNVLYVLEPIRQAWGASGLPGEFQALDFFIMNLEVLQLEVNSPIKLRPHPSDAVGKYDQWIESQKRLKVSLNISPTLAESIAWSDVVVGCQTYAMVVGLAAGRRVISSIPPWVPVCILPQAEILKLAELVR